MNKTDFFNRELSWLQFNRRVLEEAQDAGHPLMERLKFLAITASNLDEFFMVRVSGVMELVEAGMNSLDIAGMTPHEQFAAIYDTAKSLVNEKYDTLNRQIVPLLASENIFFKQYSELNAEQKEFTREYFDSTLYPILTPMAIDQGRPFPFLANKTLNIIAEITPLDSMQTALFSVINVPSVVPRCLRLPSVDGVLKSEFILIEEIVKAHLNALFSGYAVKSGCAFRITRDSDLDFEEEDADDLLDEIEKSVRNRKWGEPVRLEVERNMSPTLRNFLEEALETYSMVFYEIDGPLDLTFFFGFGKNHVKNDRLFDVPYPPVPVPDFMDINVFDAVRAKDILVHHPYESFDCVLNFIKTAAQDPDVLAIKQTLYRVSGNSPVIAALIQAAENGKHVTVLVELKARFDEENNMLMARRLEKAGCHVVYGLVGLKTHCKICLVVRRENGSIRRYLHLGTGNYNESTAAIYTDFGLFTCNELFGQDISALFNVLTGYSNHFGWHKILAAPISLRADFIKLISAERQKALNGLPAKITAKMNSLSDAEIISALYAAATAGVKIELIVRGICCLKPGVAGLSENISVHSIVGRFLEHHRIFIFGEGGDASVYLSSADWMPRNFDRRVEIAFPIDDRTIKSKLFAIMDTMFADTAKLRTLQPDGSYKRVVNTAENEGKPAFNSQIAFYEKTREEYRYVKTYETPIEQRFKPILNQ